MSSLSELIMSRFGGNILSALSGRLNTDETTTQDAISLAVPLLVQSLAGNTTDAGSAQSLFSAVAQDHDGSILDNLSGFVAGGQTSDGMGILRHILGSNQGAVAAQISRKTGLDAGAADNLLATLAPVVMGFLGKKQRESNLDVSGLSSLLHNGTRDDAVFGSGSLFQLFGAGKDEKPAQAAARDTRDTRETVRKTAVKIPVRKTVKKAAPKKPARKPVKKTAARKVAKKTAVKKAVAKKPAQKIVKKTVKKAAAKKTVGKPVVKTVKSKAKSTKAGTGKSKVKSKKKR